MMLIYLETDIRVYAYENNPVFGHQTQMLLQALRSGRHRIASSLFVLGELQVLPTRQNSVFLIALYKRLFNSPDLLELPCSPRAVDIYASLRARHRFEPLDSLHLAVAAAAGVDLFITEDTKLLGRTVPGIGRIASLNVTLP